MYVCIIIYIIIIIIIIIVERINIKNSVLDDIRYKQLNWYGHVPKQWLSRKNFGIVPTWNTKKGKCSKFVDAGGYNKNERAGNLVTWNESTKRGGERKLIYFRHRKT